MKGNFEKKLNILKTHFIVTKAVLLRLKFHKELSQIYAL